MAEGGAREALAVNRSRVSVWNLDPTNYVRHATHSEQAAWVEKNCYVDVWIEALHATGFDPVAVFPFTLAVDWEGDQWTFFKPPHGDLRTLYGFDTQELNVWRPLVEHAVHHVKEGKLVFTEADAWWLPDTQGTDYRRQHTKTTIVIETIDVEAKKLGYFHNAGYFALEGEDFVKLFRLDAAPDPAYMPFYAEIVRVDRAVKLPPKELAARSIEILRGTLARRPAGNPITKWKPRFTTDVTWLQTEGLALYHAYAFATIRQCGASFELAANYVKWLGEHGESGIERAATEFENISSLAKSCILKTARAVNAKKTVDFAPMLDAMAASWDAGIETLATRYKI
jgi:hypothetical protein